MSIFEEYGAFNNGSNENLKGKKHKTSPEYKSGIVCVFSFARIWVVIFNVQKHYVTFLFI